MGQRPVQIPQVIRVIAIVTALLGLSGAYDIISFYAFGHPSPILSLAFSLKYPNFTLFVNVLAPGIVVGPGLWWRDMFARAAALGMSLVWAGSGALFCVAVLFVLASGYMSATETAENVTMGAIVVIYSVWQFNVLRSESVRELFESP